VRASAVVSLLSGASEAPVPIDPLAQPLISPLGKVDDILAVTVDRRLVRRANLFDATEAAVLIDNSPEQVTGLLVITPLGDARYLLGVSRNDLSLDLFVYDAATHQLGASLGHYLDYVGGAVGQAPNAVVQTADEVFFVARMAGPYYRIFRWAKDGSTPPTALAGTFAYGLTLVGVAAGRLVFQAREAGLYSVALSDNFAAPTIQTAGDRNHFGMFLSGTRIFYEYARRAGAMDLDGSHAQVFTPPGQGGRWIGCTRDPATDRPASPQVNGDCERVYLHTLDTESRGGTVESFAADADPGSPLFSSALRDQITYGALPDELVSSVVLRQTADVVTYGHVLVPYGLTAGTLTMSALPHDSDRDVLFWLSTKDAPPAITFVDSAGATLRWLSRGE